MDVRVISQEDAKRLLANQESHFWDDKSSRSGGDTVQKVSTAFANADGGEFVVGFEDSKTGTGLDRWKGFESQESANWIHQSLVKDVVPAVPYQLEWLQVDAQPELGLAALVSVLKSPDVHRTSKNEVWVRRGAQSLRIDGQAVIDLQLSKGARSYEDQMLERYQLEDLVAEAELAGFLANVSPATQPAVFANRERLVDRETGNASVAAAILFAESPSAVIPRKTAVKVARYETKEPVPERKHLAATPLTIEGPARVLIDETLRQVADLVQSVSIMEPDGSMAPARYPPEALKEVIVNAVIHRDYNVSDDILVWVFDNRVEVRSPGALPGHMTVANLLSERFARNPKVVRLLNKYPDPPNKDIGEGLNTVVDKMREAKLQQPDFRIEGNAFVVRLGHTPLARPEEIVMEYLDNNPEVTNRQARELCGISSENKMKDVFLALAKAERIERVPGKGGGSSAWQKQRRPAKVRTRP